MVWCGCHTARLSRLGDSGCTARLSRLGDSGCTARFNRPGVVERRGLVGCGCTVRRSQSDVFDIRRDLVAGVWLYGETWSPGCGYRARFSRRRCGYTARLGR